MLNLFGEQISWLEIVGTIFGILGVWLTIKQNILCFPAGVVNVTLYAILFFQSKLYLNAGLQIGYILLLIYGWITWNRAGRNETADVEKTDKALLILFLIIAVGGTFILGAIMHSQTDSPFPYVDSGTTVICFIAQWMIAKKKIENWFIWIAANLIYVILWLALSKYLSAGLYFIYFVLALKGFNEWKKSLKQIPSNA